MSRENQERANEKVSKPPQDREASINSRWQRFRELRSAGVNVLLVAIGIAFAAEKWKTLSSLEQIRERPQDGLGLTLAIVTLWLSYRWIRVVLNELEMLELHFRDLMPSLPRSSYPWAMGIAMPLAALIYFSDSIRTYSLIFAAYKMVDIWGHWLMAKNVRDAMETCRGRNEDRDTLESKKAIESYYLDKPQSARSATSLAICLVVVLLANDPSNASLASLSMAYALMVGNIFLSEAVIGAWRRERDSVLGENY